MRPLPTRIAAGQQIVALSHAALSYRGTELRRHLDHRRMAVVERRDATERTRWFFIRATLSAHTGYSTPTLYGER